MHTRVALVSKGLLIFGDFALDAPLTCVRTTPARREEVMLRKQVQEQSSQQQGISRSPSPSVRLDRWGRDALNTAPSKYPFCTEEEALEKLRQWLEIHDWKDLQAHLLDAGCTSYDKYSQIEPHMLGLDEAAGVYLYQGQILQLVGADRWLLALTNVDNQKPLEWCLICVPERQNACP